MNGKTLFFIPRTDLKGGENSKIEGGQNIQSFSVYPYHVHSRIYHPKTAKKRGSDLSAVI